jgi:hypothetical protein
LEEKISNIKKVSEDGGIRHYVDQEATDVINTQVEVAKIDFKLVKSSTSAIVLFLDGGTRNFQYVNAINVICTKVPPENTYSEFLPPENKDQENNGPLFQMSGKGRKTYQSLAICVLFKDGWSEELQAPIWRVKSCFEPIFYVTLKEKEEKLALLAVASVPMLEKYKPRLFSNVAEICAALSSHALPKLKKRFLKTEDGLPIGQFTDILFKQLFETHPRIIDDSECAYVVAMLQEMFYQIGKACRTFQ